MNKKIKCLLVAGLLVIGMSGNVNALEPLTSTITNPQFEEGTNQRVVKLQDGKITITITKNDDGTYKIVTEWDSTVVKVTGLKSLFENGNMDSSNFFDEGYYCHLVVKDGDKYSVTLDKLGEIPEGFNPMGELVKVDVVFEPIDENGNGIPDFKDDEPVTPPTDPEEPPVDPEEPPVEPEDPDQPVDPEDPNPEEPNPEEPEQPKEEITDPETGDKSVILYGGLATVTVVGLCVLNRKKDEDK